MKRSETAYEDENRNVRPVRAGEYIIREEAND